MRVTIATGIYPPSIGGPATYSKLLFDVLPAHDIDVTVVSFDEVRHLPKLIRHVVYIVKLLFRSVKSDVIYAQDPVSVGLPAVIVSLLVRKKFILKIVGDYAWEQATQRFGVYDLLDVFVEKSKEYSFAVRFLKNIQMFVANRATTIVVPSEYLKQIVSAWGVCPKKIHVIYNAFTPVEVQKNKEELRKELGIEGNTIISIGRLVPWKGFGMLVSLMPDLIAKFPDIKLLIVGSGPQHEELQRVIEENHLVERVILVGALSKDELMKYLKAADVFVLNTAYEGFSHQLLEAMSVGTPVVTTRVGGNPELITDMMNGLLVRYNNRKDLEHAIEKVLTDPYIVATYTQEAFKQSARFSKERMISQLVPLLTHK